MSMVFSNVHILIFYYYSVWIKNNYSDYRWIFNNIMPYPYEPNGPNVFKCVLCNTYSR